MQKIIVGCLFLFTCVIVTFASDYLKVIYISDHTVKYGNTEYLLVRDMPTDTFSVFNNKIVGFAYEAGYTYCLLVNVHINTDTTYTLNEIKLKSKIENNVVSNINTTIKLPFDTCKWILYKLKLKDGIKTYSVPKAYLQFDLQKQILIGNTDCNDFLVTYSIQDDSISFSITQIANAICNKRSIEPDFLALLKNTTRFKIIGKLLYLYDNKKLLGLFTKKK